MKVLAKDAATNYAIEVKRTAHSFRPAGTTTLSELVMSIVVLCYAGHWKSYKTAKGCTYHSIVEKDDRANMLHIVNNAVVTSAKILG